MKSYTIRLASSPISCKLADDSYKSAIEFGFDARYFEAIDKKNVDAFFDKHNLKCKDYDAMKIAGTRACFASHFSLWKICSEINEPILILEHDGIVIRNVNNILKDVEDVCHLDPYSPFDEAYNEYVLIYNGDHVVDYSKIFIRNGTRSESNTNKFFGSYGYILKPLAATKLFEHYKSNECVASDEAINNSIVTLQRTTSTHVRMHPLLKDRETIIKNCTRKLDV